MDNVLTLDQELELSDSKGQKVESSKVTKPKKPAAPKTEKPLEENNKSISDKLSSDANAKLNYYLKRTPQFQILDKQIELLKTERENYKKNNNIENMQRCEALLEELTAKRSRIKTIFKTGSDNKNEKKKEDLYEKFKNSEKLQGLIAEQKALIKEIQKNTPTWYVNKIITFRQQISLKEKSASEAVMDLDDVLESKESLIPTSDLQQDYYDFCGEIADILDYAASEIVEMKPNKILILLKEVLTDVSDLKEKLSALKMKISSEREIISEGTNLTDIVFEIFDFASPEEDGTAPKEIIASANIGLVKAIAYNMVSKLGQQSKMDEAVSYGLLGLTVAINKWFSLQRLADSALSFKGFANQYIAGSIQRGLLELKGKGSISGSSMATLMTKEKQKIEKFIKYNPEFEDFDKDLLSRILAGYDNTAQPLNIIDESEYSGIVGGDDGDAADIWANAAVDVSSADLSEAKLEYDNLLNSIKELLNLFETKRDKTTGLIKLTGKKLFDKYDRKLFMMYFGLEFRREKSTRMKGNKDGTSSLDNSYNQDEMAEELSAYYAADGVSKTFSQPAMSGKDGRIQVMLRKIKFAVETNPKLKAGFEYLYNYWLRESQTITDALGLLSNGREEIGMKIDREELREIYTEGSSQLKRQLSDGKKLSEVFEISDSNPLDEEIGSLFSDI